jgi:sec-independent protein translocase protein TatB
MFNVGGGELLVILLVALIVLGPQRLPDAARQVGRVMGDIRRISGGFQQELKDAFDTSDGPARRTEPVPLAKAVTEADDKAAAPPADTADPGPRPLRTVEPVDASSADASAADASSVDASSVAPAVADALDEIVASARPAAVDPVDPPSRTATDQAAGEGGDGLGGERAAS